jgi:hypothetical protein
MDEMDMKGTLLLSGPLPTAYLDDCTSYIDGCSLATEFDSYW